MKVLLIYNMIPDDLQVYLLEVNQADFDMLKQCHGKFGNQSGLPDDHPVNSLSEWLGKQPTKPIYTDENDPESEDEEVSLPSLPFEFDGTGTTMIVTGFLL